jgi:hypothetical protein
VTVTSAQQNDFRSPCAFIFLIDNRCVKAPFLHICGACYSGATCCAPQHGNTRSRSQRQHGSGSFPHPLVARGRPGAGVL